MKTAILGGSFDPVHKGHLHLLSCVLNCTDYERVIVVPAHMSNFKQDASALATDAQRLEMLEIAIKEDFSGPAGKEVLIDTYELEKGGVSYTSDTVDALKIKYGVRGRIGLIIGDDHLERLSQWYNYEHMRDEVEYVVFRRNPEALLKISDPLAKAVFVDNPIVEASSTQVRNGGPDTGLLSPGVDAYVRRNALYV